MKEIIIDGVDVSGCKHYEDHTLYDCNETCEINGGIVCTNCKDNHNCYYKQLKAKEQECETLASQLDFEVQKKECLEQENEALKQSENETIEIIAELEAENKKLKKEIKYITEWKRKLNQALEEIREILIICTEFKTCEKCKFFKDCNKDLEGCILDKINEVLK